MHAHRNSYITLPSTNLQLRLFLQIYLASIVPHSHGDAATTACHHLNMVPACTVAFLNLEHVPRHPRGDKFEYLNDSKKWRAAVSLPPFMKGTMQ